MTWTSMVPLGKRAPLVSLMVTVSLAYCDVSHAQGYIAPQLAYTYPDADGFRGDEQSLGIGLGLALTPNWDISAQYEHEKLLLEPSGLLRRRDLSLHSQHAFGSAGSRPYFTVGAGIAHVSTDTATDDWPTAFLGAGYTLRPPQARTWDLQTELRGRYSRDDASLSGTTDVVDAQAIVRLRYGAPFHPVIRTGPSPPVPPANAPQWVPVSSPVKGESGVRLSVRDDRDQDGVPNRRDRCPSTIKGVSVDTDGCMLSKP